MAAEIGLDAGALLAEAQAVYPRVRWAYALQPFATGDDEWERIVQRLADELGLDPLDEAAATARREAQ